MNLVPSKLSRTTSLAALALGGLALARTAVCRSRRIDLVGRTVVVTGGSRGLGLILARRFVDQGANVALCGRDPAAVERAALELSRKGRPVLSKVCDLAKREDAEELVDEVAFTFGRIDVVVNNAGMIQVGPFDTLTLEKFQEILGANFWSAVHTTLAAMPYLREQGDDARIVNITSVGARLAVPHLAAYDASTFALEGFSEALRAELDAERSAPKVVTVIPGLMRTGSFLNAEFTGEREKEFAWFSAGAAAPILTLRAEEAARRIVVAALDGRSFLRFGLSGHVGDWLQPPLAHARRPRHEPRGGLLPHGTPAPAI